MNTAFRPTPHSPNRRETTPPANLLLLPLAGFTLLCCGLLSGCGSPGSPQPPSLKLPAPPTDLAATRSGDGVTLHWTMPRRATDRVPLTGDQRVVICRATDAHAPCIPVGSLLLQPGQPSTYIDTLPAPLVWNSAYLLTYTVLLQNHKQQSAAPSNPAYTAAGAAPPAIANLHAEVEQAGIVLRWSEQTTATAILAGETPKYFVRLHRTLVNSAEEKSAPHPDEPAASQPLEQTLEVPEAPGTMHPGTLAREWRLDHAIDQDAALNRTYRYTVERVARLTLGGHTIEVAGPLSPAVTVNARDLFPPAVPQGLQVVADVEGAAIDLSWSPDTDLDLSGYHVYRRALDHSGSDARPAEVSGSALLRNSAWRDPSAQPGIRYAYSVTAVDASGNESAPCPEVEEVLTAP